MTVPEPGSRDERPHSRACGFRRHDHGQECHPDCPTCGGRAAAVAAQLTTTDGEADDGYHVELGGQRFTQAQWEALQPYIEGRAHADSEDAATWTAPSVTPDSDQLRDEIADPLAHHAFSHVNTDGWTVCLCGHVAEGDDDDGSHARHQADVLLSGPVGRILRERDEARAALQRVRAALSEDDASAADIVYDVRRALDGGS